MPPKKKIRLESSTATTPQQDPPTSSLSTPQATPRGASQATPAAGNILTEEELHADPWTDAQESALFKAVIRFKPTGMHKHFHMLSIASHIPQSAATPHTRIPAIWGKLGNLYDLEALDEREDNHARALAHAAASPDGADDAASEDSSGVPSEFMIEEFALEAYPDFYEPVMSRRYASEGLSSPPSMPFLLEQDREVSASPAPPRRGGRGRGGRRSSTRGGMTARRGSLMGVSETSTKDEDADEDDDDDDSADVTSPAGSSPPAPRAKRRGGRPSLRGRRRGGG